MTTLNDLKNQAIYIAELTTELRKTITEKQTIKYFDSHPELSTQIQSQAASMKSQTIILWGLKEAIELKGISVKTLPSQTSLKVSRSNNWLTAGDKIGGWISYLADVPRAIDSVLVDGYQWHFEGGEEIKGPGIGHQHLDKWLQSYGWVKLAGSSIDDIYAEQGSEITSLTNLLSYFQQRQFLD